MAVVLSCDLRHVFTWLSLSVSLSLVCFVSVLASVRLVCKCFMNVYLCLCLSLCILYVGGMGVSDYGAVVSVPEQSNGNLTHAPLSPKVYPECKNLTHLKTLSNAHCVRGEEGERA